MRQGARLGSKVNASESVIIPVTGNKPKMLRGLTKRFVGGLNITPLFSEDIQLTGVKPTPKLPPSLERNRVSPYPRPSAGRPTARKADGDAGMGNQRKRRLPCNGADRD
jgi:hypothetical protein